MIGTVSRMDRGYRKAPSYEKNEDEGKLGRSDKRLRWIGRSRPYVVRDEVTITMDEIERNADVVVRRSLTASITSLLVNIFQVSTLK